MDKQYESLDVDDQTVGASQLGANQIPENMQPQIFDQKHGLNMPDGPTSDYSRNGMGGITTLPPGPLDSTATPVPYDADTTQSEDANPPLKNGPS